MPAAALELALQLATTRPDAHHVDGDAGPHGGSDKRRALAIAGPVLEQPLKQPARTAQIMLGLLAGRIGTLQVEQIDGAIGGACPEGGQLGHDLASRAEGRCFERDRHAGWSQMRRRW